MFDPAGVPAGLCAADDALGARLEDAGLTSSQPPQQAVHDGWLLRYSPGKAKRARSVNAIGPGRQSLDEKLAFVASFYRRVGLPCLYRITPYSQPATLDGVLGRAGYVACDESRVMMVELPAAEVVAAGPRASAAVDALAFSEVVGRLRGAPVAQTEAERQRIVNCPLPARFLVLHDNAEPIACGCVMIDSECAGVFNMVTAPSQRGRGHATALVRELLKAAAAAGARVAYLQVDAANAPARHVYGKFGFRDRYAYWYRAAPADEGETR
jgi:ribosomal protein S18 acetylase RimI-like enzyme